MKRAHHCDLHQACHHEKSTMRVRLSIPDFWQLRVYVLEKLCEAEGLKTSQVVLAEMPLRKRQRVCGLLLEMQGPRQLRKQAVWSAEEDRVLFYDGIGRRFLEAELCPGPGLEGLRLALESQRVA